MTGKNLGVYIHIPFCKSKCKYCAFVSTPDFSLRAAYVDALIGEINEFDAADAVCDTVYIGGGTPSCLPRGAIRGILSAVRNKFNISNDGEITVECNPESVDSEFIEECVRSGVNRISMGLQSSDDKVLKRIGRAHTFDQYLTSVKLLRAAFENISSDIILGLPEQTFDDVSRAVNTVSEYCDHLSVYALTVEDGTPLARSGYSPDDDNIADLYGFAYDRLKAQGFERYEVSNFARNGKYSRHNLKYWRNAPYIGFGVAAHGYDGYNTRYAHGYDIVKYIQNPTPEHYALSEKDRYNEYIMLALRTERGIDLDDFKSVFGYSFVDGNRDELQRMLEKKYIRKSDRFLRISPEYMFVMNGLIENLMKD